MKLIKKEAPDVVYTMEFTGDEIKALTAALGSIPASGEKGAAAIAKNYGFVMKEENYNSYDLYCSLERIINNG